MRLMLSLAVLAIACSGKPKSTTAPAAGSAAPPIANPYPTKPTGPATAPLSNAPGVKVTLADVGLEQSSLDRTTDPCVDFYQFACGGWLANNPIPPERNRWGRFQEIEERNRSAIKALLEEAAKGLDAPTKMLGDYYASCMDEATADRNGLALAKPLLDKVRLKDAKGWMAAIGELHANGIWVVWSADTFREGGTYALVLDAAGVTLVDAHKAHVARMLALAGVPKAEAAAADVIAIETELARVPRGEPAVLDAKALAKQTKAIDWKAYWKRLGVEPGKKLVAKTKLFAGVDRLKAKFKPAQWASYFTFHVLDRVAVGLGKAATDEQFEREKLASGVEKAPDRGKRCIDATQAALGDLLGQQYAAKYFPGGSKQAAATLVDALARAVADELTRMDMADAAKQTALAKLAKLAKLVGLPEKWRTYDVEIKRDDFVGNVLRAGAAETKRRLARWGKPVDRGEWELNTFATEPSYDPMANAATLPAGMLQPPFFGPDRSIAANLGGLGMSYGRALVKPFDEDVRKVDNTKCIEAQYASFEAAPKVFIDGKRTLAEAIADLGGVKIGFKAYRALRKDAAKVYVADGYTEDQQFFIAVGQASCTRDRPAELTKRLASDPHAPPKFRIYGSLRNLKEFSEAFSCAPGTPMNPATSCSVW